MLYQILFAILFSITLFADDPLPSWNESAVKKQIIEFVRATTDKSSSKFIPEEDRIVTFDQDGTLWVENPIYTQLQYCLDRAKADGVSEKDIEKLALATLTGMTVETYQKDVAQWLATAKHPRYNCLYTELAYLPMRELLSFFRKNGYRTYIVTGGGQDFVRVYANKVYGVPPEQVVGTTVTTKFSLDKEGHPMLLREPQLLINDNYGGKPEGIHLIIGRRPVASFGNSTGDKEMLEYASGLSALVLHDDSIREYAYGPALGLPDSKIGTFTQELYDEAKSRGWLIISMKSDWNRLFSFEQADKK